MSFRIVVNAKVMDWGMVHEVLKKAGLATYSLELTRKAFENSYVTVFIFCDDLLIGTGRAISDGAYQAAIYDVAVLPEYQGKGIGKVIMEELSEKLTNLNVILYTRPGKEDFYRKFNFSRMLTGMAKFKDAESMKHGGLTE